MNSPLSFRRALGLAAFALGLGATAAHAQAYSFDFDSIATGTALNSVAPAGVSFHQAYYAPSLDGFGDPIAGSEHWQIDATNDALYPVLAENPLDSGYGNAPSGPNALGALWQPVLIQFGQTVDLQSFAATLDLSAFGDLAPSSILFVNDTSVVGSLTFSETVPGLIVSTSSTQSGITGIVLPSGAFYDNVSFTVAAIPEPSTWALLLGGASLGVVALRRLRAKK